jgi:CheY-like chemotaxis protein
MTTPAPARRGRILLVEDDHEAALFAVHVLTTMGEFEVWHTMDPRVALDRACSEPWDLVLTDLHLPAMTGLDLLGALRRAAPGLPVAVVTADVTPGPALDAARRQADAFLPKPVPAAQLVAVARALMAGSAGRLARGEPRPRLLGRDPDRAGHLGPGHRRWPPRRLARDQDAHDQPQQRGRRVGGHRRNAQ